MKKIVIALISLFVWTGTAMAQPKAADPVIMTVNGVPVTRSEFEYSYNKNNSEGVIDKKTVDEYVDLFINYKLKVAAALDAKLDTLTSFKEEFAMYRDQQVKPSFVENADLMAEARKVYDDTKANIGPQGLIMPAHILLRLAQKAPKAEQDKAQLRIDSIYRALQQGADFAELAKKLSQDPGSAARGGVLPWLGPGQTLPEFEKEAYALQPGQMSKPFLSPAGYHIILMKERKQLEPFDSLKTDILRFLEQRGVRERIADENINKVAAASNGKLTRQQVLENRADELSEKDPELKNLIREYHDGLLLYEISTREVWDKAAKDEAGQEAYFKAHRKKYNWDEPRFKGMAYHVKNKADVKAVRNCVKNVPFDQWAERLRKTFNNDSIIRIRVEKGIFKKGDNALVDKKIFKQNVTVTPLKDYPIDATFGKKLKKGPEDYTDVKQLVIADYQDAMEKEWVAQLRKRYAVTVNKEVLKTVNKHH